MIGDGNIQPSESVQSLDDIAGALDQDEQATAGDEDDEALDSSDEGEDSEEAEAVDEEEEGDPDDESEPAKKTFTILHDGKEVELELTEEEEREMLQKSFDYSKKTMAVAEERKAVEAERAQAAELRSRHEQALDETVQRLEAYSKFMEAQVGTPPPISLAQQDAARYLAEKELYEARKGQLQQANAEIQRLQEVKHRERQAELLKAAESAERALRDTLPGWDDKSLNELTEYMAANGLKPELNETFVNKGLWEMAHKARAYDALQAEKAKLKPVAKPPKVHKPAANNKKPGGRQDAMREFEKNPTLANLSRLID